MVTTYGCALDPSAIPRDVDCPMRGRRAWCRCRGVGRHSTPGLYGVAVTVRNSISSASALSAAAVVIDWSAIAACDEVSTRSVRRRVESLTAAGVHVGLIGHRRLSVLRDSVRVRPCGPGRLLLCATSPVRLVEQRPTAGGIRAVRRAGPFADPLAAVVSAFGDYGIGPALVLVIASSSGPLGTLAEGSGLRSVEITDAIDALDDELRRRRRRRVPGIDEDPAWIIRTPPDADPRRQRIIESVFTIGAGGFATRGAVEESADGALPLVLAAGIYHGSGSLEELVAAPDWTGLQVEPPPTRGVRTLDLRTGLLVRAEATGDRPFRCVRFASITRPGVVALRAEAAAERLRAGAVFRPRGTIARERLEGCTLARTRELGGGVTAVGTQRTLRSGALRSVERIVAYRASARRGPSTLQPATALTAAMTSAAWTP